MSGSPITYYIKYIVNSVTCGLWDDEAIANLVCRYINIFVILADREPPHGSRKEYDLEYVNDTKRYARPSGADETAATTVAVLGVTAAITAATATETLTEPIERNQADEC